MASFKETFARNPVFGYTSWGKVGRIAAVATLGIAINSYRDNSNNLNTARKEVDATSTAQASFTPGVTEVVKQVRVEVTPMPSDTLTPNYEATINHLNSRTPQIRQVPVTSTPTENTIPLIASITPTRIATKGFSPTPAPTALMVAAGITEVPESDSGEYYSGVIPQELPINNYRLNAKSQSEVFGKIINGLIMNYPKKDSLKGANSLLTTLTNQPTKSTYGVLFQDFGPYPVTEPGLGHTPDDFKNYKDVYQLIQNQDIKLSDITRDNGNFYTSAIYGRVDDKDAISYLAAWTILYWQHQDRLKDATMKDLFTDNSYFDLRQDLIDLQNKTLARIQKKYLNLTNDETDRRKIRNGVDASAYIPDVYRGSNQAITCDVDEMDAKVNINRRQNIRDVLHMKGAKDGFKSANVDKEGILIAISIDKKNTKNWGVRGITNRWYFDPSIYGKIPPAEALYNAAGEQELPCGEALPKPTPTKLPVLPQVNVPQGNSAPQSVQPGKGPAGDQVNKDGEGNGDRGTGQSGGDAGGTR